MGKRNVAGSKLNCFDGTVVGIGTVSDRSKAFRAAANGDGIPYASTSEWGSGMPAKQIKEQIDTLMGGSPEVLYGIANIYYSPYCGEYFSAIVIAVPYDVLFTSQNYSEPLFSISIEKARVQSADILSDLVGLLHANGQTAWIPSAQQQDEENLKAPFSLKYAAVNAGIGWIGKNDVLVTQRYGPRVALGAVLTDIILPYDEPIWKSNCPDECTACMDACPYNAIHGVQWNIDALRENMLDFHLCNSQRSKSIASAGRKNSCGLCMVACPFGLGESEALPTNNNSDEEQT